MVLIPDSQLVEEFVYHSNLIEGASVVGDSPWVTRHLAGAHAVIADALLGQLTPPESFHTILFDGLIGQRRRLARGSRASRRRDPPSSRDPATADDALVGVGEAGG